MKIKYKIERKKRYARIRCVRILPISRKQQTIQERNSRMSDKATQPKRVLVTGSTGAIGEPVAQHLLARGHTVRGFARRPSPGLEDYVVGDLNDQEAVRRAVEGMEVVIHLGAYPNDADFLDVLLEPNVRGLFHICDAAREFKVERLSSPARCRQLRGMAGRPALSASKKVPSRSITMH